VVLKTSIELSGKVKEFIRTGNADLFTEIYEASYGYLHTCAIHVMKNEDEAQDILQDSYIEIFRNLSSLKDPDTFLGWAATITNRKCFAALKNSKDVLVTEQVDEEGNVTDFFDNIKDDEAFIPENILDNEENCRLVREIVDGLNETQRLCVISYFFNEKKQDEIAEEYGIPLNTVKSHLSRAKAKMKEAVEDMEKNKGTKLYALAPFMLLLFSKEAKACDIPPLPDALKSVIEENLKATGNAVKATEAAKKAAGSVLYKKIIITGLIAIVTVGAVSAIALNSNRNKQKADTEEQFVEENASETGTEELQSQDMDGVEESLTTTSDSATTETTEDEEVVDETEVLRNGWLSNNNIVITPQGQFTYVTTISDAMHDSYTTGEINVPCTVSITETTDGCEDGYKEVACTFTSDFTEAHDAYWHFTCDIVDRYTGIKIEQGSDQMSHDFEQGEARADGYSEYANIVEFDGNSYEIRRKAEGSYIDHPIFQNTESILCPVDYDGAIFVIGYNSLEMQQSGESSSGADGKYNLSFLDPNHTYYYFTYSND
jgi:RNA polymerase sigma factor (sigma-70 family)